MAYKYHAIFIAIIAISTTACVGPKKLETYVNNHRAVSLRAEAIKTNNDWEVSMLLPAGEWKVDSIEDQKFTTITGIPRSTIKWKVTRERWNQQDKPFNFKITNKTGSSIQLSVKYPNFISNGALFFLELVGSLASHQ